MITVAVNSPRAEYLVLEGGTHSLTNMMPEAGEAVVNWLASLSSAVGQTAAAAN